MTDTNNTELNDPNTGSVCAVGKNMAAIVLAGGLSQRMGEHNKLLLEVDGQSLLRGCVGAVLEAGVGEIIVVLGHESDQIQAQIADLNLPCVFNTEYQGGQMTSVQCGLNAISGSKQAVMICLADQPLIKANHIKQLITAFENLPDDKNIVVPMVDEKRGNPVIIHELVRQEVVHHGGNPGCRKFIDNHPEQVHWLQVNDVAFTTDIDTKEEFEQLIEALAQPKTAPADKKPKT